MIGTHNINNYRDSLPKSKFYEAYLVFHTHQFIFEQNTKGDTYNHKNPESYVLYEDRQPSKFDKRSLHDPKIQEFLQRRYFGLMCLYSFHRSDSNSHTGYFLKPDPIYFRDKGQPVC